VFGFQSSKITTFLTRGDRAGVAFASFDGFLCVSVNEPSHSIGEQHIHFLRLDDGGDFALAKRWVRQGLALSISPRAVVRRSNFGRSAPHTAGLVRDARFADRTTNTRDSAGLRDRHNHVPSLFLAAGAHLFDSITDFENWFLFHCFTP
jgi:hypothetical protein